MGFQLKPACPFITRSRQASKAAIEVSRRFNHIVYLIIDPSVPDRFGRYPHGEPIYVGETRDLYQRIRNHISNARANDNGPDSIQNYLRALMAAGEVPLFKLLDHAVDRPRILMREKHWTKILEEQGYPLRNRVKKVD